MEQPVSRYAACWPGVLALSHWTRLGKSINTLTLRGKPVTVFSTARARQAGRRPTGISGLGRNSACIASTGFGACHGNRRRASNFQAAILRNCSPHAMGHSGLALVKALQVGRTASWFSTQSSPINKLVRSSRITKERCGLAGWDHLMGGFARFAVEGVVVIGRVDVPPRGGSA